MKQRQRPRLQHRMEYTPLSTKNGDDSDEETELFLRKSFQDVLTVEKDVEEGDTLQALSLQYHCPIAELKRLNNIHRENEIFAKRTIKVPARSFSVAVATVHVSGTSSPNEKKILPKEGLDAKILKSRLTDKILNTPSCSNTSNSNDKLSTQSELNEVIFNSDVKPVIRSCDKIDSMPLVNIDDEENVSLLPRSDPIPDPVVSRLSCSGADADISWIALIICIVIVILAVPLIYVFYIAEHPEQYHRNHS